MSVIDRGLDTLAVISDHFNEVLRRRLRELAGLALIALAFTGAAALATWSVQDPSLSHATSAPVRNIVGYQGAIAADLLMQLFGLASTVLVLLVAILGWRLFTHRPLYRELWRFVMWLVAATFAAGFASCVPPTATWPLPSGLGGVIGDAVLRIPTFFVPLNGITRIGIASVTGVIALIAFAIAAGMFWRNPHAEEDEPETRDDYQDEEEERGSNFLGWLWHGLFSLKARLRLLFAEREVSPVRRAVQQARVEPRFTEAADLEEEFE